LNEQEEARTKLHLRLNFRICTALDMIKVGMILDEMVAENVLHPNAAKTFHAQATALLASLRNVNNQAFGLDPQAPIY
jgi:hypothetical protein